MAHEETKIKKQISLWEKFGVRAPLAFVAIGVVTYLLHWFEFHLFIIVAGGFAAAVAVIWWWWALYTLHKLDRLLTNNTENFIELVGIVKDLNRNIHEQNNSARQRREQKKS